MYGSRPDERYSPFCSVTGEGIYSTASTPAASYFRAGRFSALQHFNPMNNKPPKQTPPPSRPIGKSNGQNLRGTFDIRQTQQRPLTDPCHITIKIPHFPLLVPPRDHFSHLGPLWPRRSLLKSPPFVRPRCTSSAFRVISAPAGLAPLPTFQ